MLKSALLILSIPLLVGCGADPAGEPLPPNHPANPAAAEARQRVDQIAERLHDGSDSMQRSSSSASTRGSKCAAT